MYILNILEKYFSNYKDKDRDEGTILTLISFFRDLSVMSFDPTKLGFKKREGYYQYFKVDSEGIFTVLVYSGSNYTIYRTANLNSLTSERDYIVKINIPCHSFGVDLLTNLRLI